MQRLVHQHMEGTEGVVVEGGCSMRIGTITLEFVTTMSNVLVICSSSSYRQAWECNWE
jgi:hypothetical protein